MGEKEGDSNNKNLKDKIKTNEIKDKDIPGQKPYIDEYTQKYIDILDKNPASLFQTITPESISIWQSKIYNFDITIIDSDSQIITTVPDRKDQSLIKVDSKRTRYREKTLIPGYEKILELMLTFYCNSKKINYKQGLNEIFGALLLIKYKLNYLKLANILNIGEAFIDKFLANYYYEKEVYSLKNGIHIFSLLLKYHEPNIYYYLDKFSIPNELYVTNWILTFRAQKLNIDILYILIDNIIKLDDPLFINFILVALIKSQRELLLSSEGKNLTKLLFNLTFNTKEELINVINIALELRNQTPYSYRFLANNMGIYKTKEKNIEINKPNFIPTMPIYPLEILYNNFAYNNKIICPDKNCPHNIKNNKIMIDWENEQVYNSNIMNNYICEKCTFNIKKNIIYIILDLRIFEPSQFKSPEDFFKMGIISGTFEINKEELLSGDLDKLLSNRLLSIRGDHHLILMTSRTDYFGEYEEKFYSEQTNIEKRKKMLLGIIDDEKIEKILNLEGVEKDLNLKELYQLKEYDNLRKILNSLRDKNFPYVSYLEGGFEALHQECLNYNIELVEHDENKCILCNAKKCKKKDLEKIHFDKNISENLWKNKMISINELNKFLSNKQNVILICSIQKFKNKFYNEKIEIFLIFLYDKNIIEIYNKEKQINNKNSNYYNLGVNPDNNKEIMLRHFYTIQFNEIININQDKKSKNIISFEIKNNEKELDYKLENIEIELEFYSKEDSTSFKDLIKKIKKSK